MSDRREDEISIVNQQQYLPAFLGMCREHGWSYLAEFLEIFESFAIAILGIWFVPWVGVAAAMGLNFIKVAALRRACDRYNKTLQLLPFQVAEFKERFAEVAADIQVEIHELSRKCFDEPYNRKYRYYVEFLLGRMSTDQALAKDKYYRFRRWVEQLDLVALRCMSKYSNSPGSMYWPRNAHLIRGFFSGSEHSQSGPKFTNLTYLEMLTDGKATTEWELIPQLAAVGILHFDRGGGAATPNEQASLIWHHDAGDFADYLRKADERPIWKTTELDEGEEASE